MARTPARGFYLLAPGTFGLRRHFKLPEKSWGKVRDDLHRLLRTERRVISLRELIKERKFPWVDQTSAYELAQIVCEDNRFVYLGRFHFALAASGIRQRPLIKDLLLSVLAKAGRPLTPAQILDRLRGIRPASENFVRAILRKHPLIKRLELGHYGLCEWKDTPSEAVLEDRQNGNDSPYPASRKRSLKKV